MSSEQVRAHVWVTGRVQGVGFRAFVQQSGAQIGVIGWVRNVGWNRVEAVAEGGRDQVERFIEAMQRGPRAARVDETKVEWETPTGEFRAFDVKASR
jgi:acylphosphatase